jgi:hypothetical protein
MTTTARRLTARQLAKALAEIDHQLAGLYAVRAAFVTHYTNDAALADEVCDAWNATHDAIREILARRVVIAENARPMPAAGQGTWELIQRNID